MLASPNTYLGFIGAERNCCKLAKEMIVHPVLPIAERKEKTSAVN